MARNWAWECGKFMSLSSMMRDVIRQLAQADDEWDRRYLLGRLELLAQQTDEAIVEFEQNRPTVD